MASLQIIGYFTKMKSGYWVLKFEFVSNALLDVLLKTVNVNLALKRFLENSFALRKYGILHSPQNIFWFINHIENWRNSLLVKLGIM